MISSNTRASRSRFSSPAQPTEISKNLASEASSRSFMQRWLEPSIQSKASFEEAGLVRYGVLETMAPLGTLPKSKKNGNENGGGQQPVRKIILRPSGVHAASHDEDSGAPPSTARQKASPPLPPPTTSSPPALEPSYRRLQAAKDAEDGEYDPKGGSRRRQSRRVSLPTKPRQTIVATDCKSPAHKPKPVTPKRARQRDPVDLEFADKVVEAAVEEALKHYRYPTAWALRSLYDERSGDSSFVAMIEEVFKQTADEETMEEFNRLVELKKREGKKDDLGCYYFVPPSTNSRFTPHKPKPAPYAKLLHHHADDKSETRAAKRSKTSHAGETPRSKKQAGANGLKSHSSTRTPSRRRVRRGSGSSESSLSSAMSLSSPEDSINSLSLSPQQGAGRATTRRASAAGATVVAASITGGRSQSHDAPKSQPITSAHRKSLASSKQAMSNTSERSSPTHPSHTHKSSSASTADASMPGRIASSDLFPNLHPKSASGGKLAHSKDGSSAVKAQMLADGDNLFWSRRRDAQKVTNGYTARESSIRDAEEEERDEATPVRRTRRTRHSLGVSLSTRATRSASKRPNNEEADITVSSPLAFSFNEGSSTVGSRAATPTAFRPAKKPRTGLRIKSSPMKKKGGTAAGVPRLTGEAQSASVINGAPREQGSDNDEYCSACGNTGDVVCCDGCPRSFHFECVDMVQSENLPDEWYCNECLVRRYPSRVPVHRGAFAGALNNLEKSIPRAFSLPKKLQNRFEGVKAGADGDYEEVTNNRKKRPGYDEVPDFFKLREDGEPVLCHACQKPATEIQAIIPCSACPFHWHIDCLDPPLAMPPVLKNWRCPAHMDDVLVEVPPLAPAHRFRKVKGGHAISPIFTRGVKNNGHIEIDWADELEEPEKSGWRDPDSFGRTYKLPAKGIVLDFIEQLRHRGAGYGPRRKESRWVPFLQSHTNDVNGPFVGSSLDRTVDEIQASLNLIGLKQKRSENIDKLVSVLLSAAEDNVLALMARGNADNIVSGQLDHDDKLSLRAMLIQMNTISARIRDLLGEDTLPSTVHLRQAVDTESLLTERSGMNTFQEKAEPTAPVTEPTPPSTVDHGEGAMELD